VCGVGEEREIAVQWHQLTLESWNSQGVTSDEAWGVRGRELVGETGRECWLLPMVLLSELPRLRIGRWLCASGAYGRLVSEFWRPSAGKSSPKMFCSFLWKPRLILDLDPVLLTVVALATDGRRSSLSGKPMLSSRLPFWRRKPGEGWVRSSLESLKKLLQTLLAMAPPLVVDQGAMCELALEAVGGFRDIDGTLPPEVSNTASCFR